MDKLVLVGKARTVCQHLKKETEIHKGFTLEEYIKSRARELKAIARIKVVKTKLKEGEEYGN